MARKKTAARTLALPTRTPTKSVASIFGGRATSKNKREQKLITHHIMYVTTYDGKVTYPKYLNWSEHPITFSRADQRADIPYPGSYHLGRAFPEGPH